MKKVVRKLTVFCLLLFAFAGSASAQNDPLFVIKKDGHYLAHVGTYDSSNDTTIWNVQDATAFDPTTCLWRSGNTVNVLGLHHNYYFIDTYGNYRFLSAPLQASGQLSLSTSLPSIQLLRNTDQIYYFYDWDPDQYGAGVARGHKHYSGSDATACGDDGYSWHWYDDDDHTLGGECWEVYWVEFNANNEWRLTPQSHYSRNAGEDNGQGGVPNAGLYRDVTVTEHQKDVYDENGGLVNISVPTEMEWEDPGEPLSASITLFDNPSVNYTYHYKPAYTTYDFEGSTYYFDAQGVSISGEPGQQNGTGTQVSSYLWTLSGDGADYLAFDDEGYHSTSDLPTPTLYYWFTNNTFHKTATVTLTVTYNDGGTQSLSKNVTVKAVCDNPGQSADPVVTYEGVTVSWYPTASQYKVYLTTDDTWATYTEYDEVGDVTSYTFTGLENNTQYYYKIVANCDGYNLGSAYSYDFTTKGEAGLLVYGAVFGGGRMGDVGGNTEVAIINCDSIHAVYGGNDIAETVSGAAGATITIGVEENDPNDFDDYGTTNAPIRIGDVYGGGNGYYAYNGTSFEPASYNTVYTIEPDASVLEMTQQHQLGDVVWTNTSGSDKTLVCPTITKAKITVTNDYVKIDSVFGGAKNAILNATSDDVTINIYGGTIFTVFGGNNFGGSLGYQSQERILVTHTTTETGTNYHSGTLGRDFGIGYLFGGGNKVYGQHAHITIVGGQMDTVFGGGNREDLRSTVVTVNCPLGTYSSETGAFGSVYSNAISSYSSGNLAESNIDGNYLWNRSGIYNIRTLFGGNNMAAMEGVPTLTLTSGGIGTVYGGGNEGDMLAQETTTITAPTSYGNPSQVYEDVKYGTHVQMNSPNILIDFLYGGCQKSNVDYSTWVELINGHVGTVYGGCNISGDVGSTRVYPSVPSNPPSEAYQEVQGATFVKASGGVVYKTLFGGSNGFYHCNDGIYYTGDISYCPPENYLGWPIPTHNETHAIITTGAKIKGNVYAGGNMAPVGFTDATVGDRAFPQFVGLASLRMDGGTVERNVFGGGNMASILGGNEVMVSGGSIGMTPSFDGALYGGNDRSGQAGQISNRVFPASYNLASDGYTSLTDVNTYVSLTGKPYINTVYGGGNGDYDYEHGDDVIPEGHYCSYEAGVFNDKPIQTNTFVDINITGNDNDGQDGGHINTVYGGGNGVTVTGSITVFLNVKDPIEYDHVGTIFGGNNKDNVVEFENAPLVPDIILLHGQVGTVYGGCNRGAMTTGKNFTIGDSTYYNIGSMVRLRKEYKASNTAPTVIPDAVVSKAVYGGCRMNDVTYSSLVIVEGGAAVPATAKLFGGCDISGAVGDTSYVVVTGGNMYGNIYAGGNGNYTYGTGENAGNVYEGNTLIATGNDHNPPTSRVSRVDLLGGQIGADADHISEVFGGGYGQPTNTEGDVIVNIGPEAPHNPNNPWENLPVIYGNVYGGSAFGKVNYVTTGTEGKTTVNFLNGTLHGMLFGGGLGRKANQNQGITPIEAKNYGKVFVNISNEDQTAANCLIDLRDADIYGCNNQNGSPQNDVTVHVWKTAFNFPLDEHDYSAATGEDPYYAIYRVFGGGNQANYAPMTGEGLNLDKKILVYVHECLNTIHWVYAGGNAADATRVSANIEGGRMNYVFGGGNGAGQGNPGANIGDGGTHTVVSGGTINHLFGGSNEKGDISGPLYTEVNNDSGCEQEQEITEFYGGCNLAPLSTNNGVYSVIKCGAGTIAEAYGGSKLADIVGNVTLDVRGGTIASVYGGSKGQEGTDDDDAADISDYPAGHTLAGTGGNVTLNLEGGTITDAYGGTNINGAITGSITVNVLDFGGTCGLDLTNVYGGGNLTPYTPTDPATSRPVVNVMHIERAEGIRGDVFGGAKGDATHPATVTANPIVNIGYNETTMSGYLAAITDVPSTLVPANFRAFVTGSIGTDDVSGGVFGGGNLAPVVGTPTVNVYSGQVVHKVVGGGNQAGITGSTNVNVYGGTIGTDATTADKGVYGGCNRSGTVTGSSLVELTGGTIGVSGTTTANVHGGGYGNDTQVAGNVTVNFGDDTNDPTETLVLFGDLYGGSALGDVNTNDQSNPGNSTTTIVNLRNGRIVGAAYGGGLGQKSGVGGATSNDPAWVYGKVYVRVGAEDPSTETGYTGQANLVDCKVYGCNNLNGSPLSDVEVHVYQTAHDDNNMWNNYGSDATYAIYEVFGGGNQANWADQSGTLIEKSVKVNVHGCLNTIKRVFGGGDAADVYGVEIRVDGGRYWYIFGGGNGERGAAYPANIGAGGINLGIGGGYIGTLVNGSNMYGSCSGSITSYNYESTCGDLTVTDYFLGSNQSDIFGDIDVTIYCIDANAWNYQRLYCGSNKSQIWGNINVTIQGGTFLNVFGGSKGEAPHGDDPGYASNISVVTQEIISGPAGHPEQGHPELVLGHGGNVTLTINGGSIGNLYGGCDQNGNIEGKISITVEEDGGCALFIGDIYGGGNVTSYVPTIDNYKPTSTNPVPTPNICILKASQIGGDMTFAGSTAHFAGNVFGGGNRGYVTSNPKVIVGKGITNSPVVNILGSVYGGGNMGDVNGSPQVVVMPETHALSYTQEYNTQSTPSELMGRAYVYDGTGATMPVSGNTVGEGLDLRIKAIASVYGWTFTGWTASNGTIVNTTDANSLFTMGTNNASITAAFDHATTHLLTYSQPAHGEIDVKDGFDQTVPSGSQISEGAVLYLTASNPTDGYRFKKWTVTNGYVANALSASTTFIMGTEDITATISAEFELIPTHILTFEQPANGIGTITVTDSNNNPVASGTAIREGTVLNISAAPADPTQYQFSSWQVTEGDGTIANRNAATTTFTMRTQSTTIQANFSAIEP